MEVYNTLVKVQEDLLRTVRKMQVWLVLFDVPLIARATIIALSSVMPYFG